MIVGNRDLHSERLLIAEIGSNHEGAPSVALDMVDAAAESGADAVKVQVINPERLVNRSQTDRIAQLSKFRLPFSVLELMAQRAADRGLMFMASAFDEESLKAVCPLIVAIKIASGDLDFGQLLAVAAALNKPLILSTGMATMAEVEAATETIGKNLSTGRRLEDSLILLHCVSLYPTPLDLANLRAIQTLEQRFNLTVGYSDHCMGIESAVMALALGARVIEKHFTIDKNRSSFRDHQLSADPLEMARLSAVVHGFDQILGTGEKKPSTAEVEASEAARRSIVASRDLEADAVLTLEDFDYVRPRHGLLPSAAPTLVGRRLRLSLKRHEVILEEHLHVL